MRAAMSCAATIACLGACGRLAFDRLDTSDAVAGDIIDGDIIDGDVTIDACSFGLFGGATQLPNVNGTAEDFSPYVSYDGLSLYFGKQAPNYEVYRSVRADTSAAFPAGTPVAELNTAAVEGGPSLSLDQLDVVFFSTRVTRQDIWIGSRTATAQPFSGIRQAFGAVGPLVRDAPEISPDGLTLYYTNGGLGSNREIHRGVRPDRTSLFTDLGPVVEVNSSQDDGLPSVSDDHLEMYFRSNRSGGYRLWVARRARTTDAWGTPVPVAELDLLAPNVSDPELAEGGTAMYFTHDSGDGTSWNIYVARRACM
ncbi:MAG TPA: hypothetical protein VIV11_40465 [Kofleriaceae bacterium]